MKFFIFYLNPRIIKQGCIIGICSFFIVSQSLVFATSANAQRSEKELHHEAANKSLIKFSIILSADNNPTAAAAYLNFDPALLKIIDIHSPNPKIKHLAKISNIYSLEKVNSSGNIDFVAQLPSFHFLPEQTHIQLNLLEITAEIIDEINSKTDLLTYNTEFPRLSQVAKKDTLYNTTLDSLQVKKIYKLEFEKNTFIAKDAVSTSAEDNQTSVKASMEIQIKVIQESDKKTHSYNASSQTPAHSGRFYNFPNPFVNTTILAYYLSKSGVIHINIVDVNGKIIKTENRGYQTAGQYFFTINRSSIHNGLYYCRLQSSEEEFDAIKIIVQ